MAGRTPRSPPCLFPSGDADRKEAVIRAELQLVGNGYSEAISSRNARETVDYVSGEARPLVLVLYRSIGDRVSFTVLVSLNALLSSVPCTISIPVLTQ